MRSPAQLLRTAAQGWRSPWAVVVGAVLLSNAAYVLGITQADPALHLSGLGYGLGRGVVRGLATIDPNAGFISDAMGRAAASSWLHGHVPWWNYYEGLGTPMAGEVQSAAFSPLTLLLALPGGWLVEHLAFQLIGGLATVALLRRLGVRDWVTGVGGALYACNGALAWLAHAPAGVVPFVPVMLLGVEHARAAAVEGRRTGWALLTAGTALALLGGFVESAYLAALLALGWLLLRSVRNGWRFVLSAAWRCALGVAAGALIAAPVLVAFADYLPHAVVGLHATDLLTRHLPAAGFGATLIPYVTGPIFTFQHFGPHREIAHIWANIGGYLGSALLPLAFVGLAGARHRVLRIGLAVVAVLTLGHMFGWPGFPSIAGLVPGMSKVAFYRYAVPDLDLALIVLGCLGLDDLAALRPRRTVVAAATVLGGLVLLGALAVVWRDVRAIRPVRGGEDWVLFALAVAAIGAAAPLLGVLRRSRLVPVVGTLAVAQAVVLFAIPTLAAPRTGHLDTALPRLLHRTLGLQRIATLGPLAPNYGTRWQVAEVDSNDLPIPRAYADYLHRRLDPNVNPLDFNGGPAGRSRRAPTPAAEVAAHLDGYRDAGVAAVVVPARSDPFAAGPPAGLRPGARTRTGVVYEVSSPGRYWTARGCTLTAATRARVTATCAGVATLLRRELVMPGWHAHVGGRSVAISDDGDLQAIRLPAGRSVVSFDFLPPHEVAAGVGALAGLAVLVAGLLTGRRRPRD